MALEALGVGIGTTQTATPRTVTIGNELYLPGGKLVDGSKARDPGNTGDITVLRAGMLMGKITSGGKYAPSVLGVLSGAGTEDDTELTVSAAVATEINRRIGSSGTFKLTGPPSAAGTVRTSTVTYSAVDTGTGAITVTALSADEVWTLTFGADADGGNFRIGVTTSAGTTYWTGDLAYNASAATIETAVEALTGVGAGNLTVAGSAGGPYTFTGTSSLANQALGFTLELDNHVTDGGVIEAGSLVQTTAGGTGAFIAGAFVQPTDGSETPLGLLANGSGLEVYDRINSANITSVPLDKLVIGGLVDSSQIINWPSDTSLQAWVVDQLNAAGQFVFDHKF